MREILINTDLKEKEELYKKLKYLKINSLNISDIFFDKKENNFTNIVNKIKNIGINKEEIFAKKEFHLI